MFGKISLFIISKSDTLDNPQDILTFTSSEKDCEEYTDRFLRAEKEEHFLSWCNMRNLDSDDINAWLAYRDLCCNEERFFIFKIKVTKNAIASVYRQLYSAIPVGCSFETPSEILSFYYKFDKQLYKKLKKSLEDLDKQNGKQK